MGTIKFSFRKYGLNVFLSQILFFSLALSMGQKHDNFTNQGFDFFTGPPPQLEGVIFFWTLSGGIFVQAFRGDFAILFHFFVLMKKF